MGKQLNSIMFFLLYGEDFKRFSCDGSCKREAISLKAIPTGNPTPLANAAIDIPPVITIDLIRPVSTIPVIVLNCFIFLAICSQVSVSSRKYVSISDNFFNQ